MDFLKTFFYKNIIIFSININYPVSVTFVPFKFKYSNLMQKLANDLNELSVIFLQPFISKYFKFGLYVAISSVEESPMWTHSPKAIPSKCGHRLTNTDTQLFFIYLKGKKLIFYFNLSCFCLRKWLFSYIFNPSQINELQLYPLRTSFNYSFICHLFKWENLSKKNIYRNFYKPNKNLLYDSCLYLEFLVLDNKRRYLLYNLKKNECNQKFPSFLGFIYKQKKINKYN